MPHDAVARPSSATVNLDAVLTAIAADTLLTPLQRRDLRSSIQRLSRIKGWPPAALPASLVGLRPILKSIDPVAVGLSQKSLQNLSANLSKAVRRYAKTTGIGPARGTPMSPVWQILHRGLPAMSLRNGLSRLAHWCSDRGIAPTDVGADVIARFGEYLEHETSVTDPQRILNQTKLLWNRAGRDVEGWLGQPLPAPPKRIARRRTWEELPEDFRADAERYLTWLGGKSLDDDAPQHPCKPSTLRTRRDQLRGAISMALDAGIPAEKLQSLADLINPDMAKVILEGYLNLKSGKATSYIIDLAEVLVSISNVWVHLDAEALARLRKFVHRLGPQRNGMADKNRKILRCFDDDKTLGRLLFLPEKLMAMAEKRDHRSFHTLAIAQTAVQIAILQFVPLRIGNLAHLRLSQNLERPGGPHSNYIIVLRPDETKNEERMEFPLNSEVTGMIDRYLGAFRLHHRLSTSPWLFPGDKGAKTPAAVYRQIVSNVKRHVGIKMTVHAFRHLSAKLYLDNNPGQFEVVRRILGHRSIKTTIGFYAEFDSRRATQLYDKNLTSIKAELGDPARRRLPNRPGAK